MNSSFPLFYQTALLELFNVENLPTVLLKTDVSSLALAVYTLFLDLMQLPVHFNRAFVSLKFRPFEWLIFKFEKQSRTANVLVAV